MREGLLSLMSFWNHPSNNLGLYIMNWHLHFNLSHDWRMINKKKSLYIFFFSLYIFNYIVFVTDLEMPW